MIIFITINQFVRRINCLGMKIEESEKTTNNKSFLKNSLKKFILFKMKWKVFNWNSFQRKFKISLIL